MSLEQQLMQLPKPALAALIISIVIVLLFIMQPPHTICDAQMENIQKNQEGILFPIKVKKREMPGRIQSAMESCRFGNSSGACFEYFSILRKAAVAVKNAPSECTSALMGVSIKKYAKMEEYTAVPDGQKTRDELSGVTYSSVNLEEVFRDGMEMMVRKAWGEAPPEPGAQRFGWFQESEMNAFCHVRDIFIRVKGREGLKTMAKAIYPKLPGEAPPPRDLAEQRPQAFVPKKATQVFTESQIFERSLFSAPCDFFR